MLADVYDNGKVGINTIKLRDLLSEQDKTGSSPVIRSLMPPVEIGSITLVDQIVLLSLARLTAAKSIIEIGTYLGYTTSLLAMNTSAKIVSIDLPRKCTSGNILMRNAS